MITWIIILFLTTVHAKNKTASTCYNHQANFDIKEVIGKWHAVAIIPEKIFPEQKEVICHEVEISETDAASLRWMLNTEYANYTIPKKVAEINGVIVRLYYDYGETFNIWAQGVEGVNGCFKQILTMNMVREDFVKVGSHDAMMQLHLIHTDEKSGAFLVQMLWGKLLSAVVYRRYMGITQDELHPVFELLSKLRGPQRTPRICVVRVNKLLDEKNNYSKIIDLHN